MSIRFNKVDLTAVAAQIEQFPKRPLAEIIMVGRSNVGKSTLLNALCRNKTSREQERKFSRVTDQYFQQERLRAAVLLLIDIRRGFGDLDWQMADYLDHYHIPWQVVLTKADKLSRSKQNDARFSIIRELNERRKVLGAESFHLEDPIMVSATTANDAGVENLRRFITSRVK